MERYHVVDIYSDDNQHYVEHVTLEQEQDRKQEQKKCYKVFYSFSFAAMFFLIALIPIGLCCIGSPPCIFPLFSEMVVTRLENVTSYNYSIDYKSPNYIFTNFFRIESSNSYQNNICSMVVYSGPSYYEGLNDIYPLNQLFVLNYYESKDSCYTEPLIVSCSSEATATIVFLFVAGTSVILTVLSIMISIFICVRRRFNKN